MATDDKVQMGNAQLVDDVICDISATAHIDLTRKSLRLRHTDCSTVRVLNGAGIAVPCIQQSPAAVGFYQDQCPLCSALDIHIEVIQPVCTVSISNRMMPNNQKSRQHKEKGQNMQCKMGASPHDAPHRYNKDSF